MGIKFNRENLDRLNGAIAESFEATVEAFAEQCQTEIESDKWEWPRTTHRQNGEVVTSPRNIVDTGRLRDSQRIEIEGDSAVVEWAADYALKVHEGIVENGFLKPGRPWTETALEEIDLEQVMAEEMRDRL